MVESSQTATIYERLRGEILSLERTPGARLTERALESEFGVSRTPARAALMRLETEGLVRRDGRAWQVSPIDLAEVAALYEFREALESAAVRLACRNASDADIAALDELLGAFDSETSSEDSVHLGADFHVELARLSGNPFIADAIDSAMTRLARARWLEVRSESSRHSAWQEHRSIVEAIAARDEARAVNLVEGHVGETRDRLSAFLDPDRQRALRARGLMVVA
jgi:DNA-binding GntR family transcriptional regulator